MNNEKVKNYIFIDESNNIIQKIQNKTLTISDLENLSDDEMKKKYNYVINNICIQCSLLYIACLTSSLSIVKLFDLHFYKGFNIAIIRLNDLGEDIYCYLLENGFTDSLIEIELSKNTVYEKYVDYEKMKKEHQEKFKNDKTVDIEVIKKLKPSDLNIYFKYSVDNNNLDLVKLMLSKGVEIFNCNLNFNSISDEIITEIITHCLRNKIVIKDNSPRILKIISEVVSDNFIILSP